MNEAGLWFFDPNLRAILVGQPGPTCTSELLIDPTTPSASLLVTVLRWKAQCGVAMPSTFLKLPEDQIACVESWVNGVVAGQ
jgi:hypothetical protein